MQEIAFDLQEAHTPREWQLVHASLLTLQTLLVAQTAAERRGDLTPEDEAEIRSAVEAFGHSCFPDIAFVPPSEPTPG